MARKKLPEDQVLTTVGIKLPSSVIQDLEDLAKEWDSKSSAVGREMLLLGLAVYKATQQSRIFTDLIWRGSLSKEELRSQFSRILGEPDNTPQQTIERKIEQQEGSKVTAVTAEIKEVESNQQEEQPSVTLRGFGSLEEAIMALKQVEAGTHELVPIEIGSSDKDQAQEGVVLEMVEISTDPSDPEPFKPEPTLPAGTAKIIFPPTRPLKG